MKRRLRERETSDAKGAVSGDKTATLTRMGRFKSLARRLVKIPRAELDKARKDEQQTARRKPHC